MPPANEGDAQFVLVDGPPQALRFLAELLTAVADDPLHHGLQLSPTGAGSFHVSTESEVGLYVHRLPCPG